MIRVSIVGATGYTGGELLRFLVRHPEVELRHLTSENFKGIPISDVHPFLKGVEDRPCVELNIDALAKDSDVVFLGLPHGAAAKTGAAFFEKGVRVIDLSADFRLQDLPTYKKWYGLDHPAPALLKEAVYGLPERYRERIKKAKLVANPGCYATTTILSGLPLLEADWIEADSIVVDAKSGVSGAGRKLDNMYLYCEANETMLAYGLKGHRHHPEILQEWMAVRPARSGPVSFMFVPHLIPMNRGIFATVYARLKKTASLQELHALYKTFYAKEFFVRVLEPGKSPEVKGVSYTNGCHIGMTLDSTGKNVVIMAALDNLVKGASGQAIQNMNIMFGLKEETALL